MASPEDSLVTPPIFAGRIATVVGAGSGIGAAIAGVLAEAGGRVHCVDVSAESVEHVAGDLVARGYDASWGQADATDSESIEHAVDDGVARHGRLDAFITTVGDNSRLNLLECPPEEWERMQAVNVRSAYLGVRAALPHLIDRGEGSIVLLASRASFVGVRNSAAYCAAKGAIVGLTRQLAADYGWDGIRVNALAPSGTDDTGLFIRGRDPEPVRRRFIEGVPLCHHNDRLILPRDVAFAALFLVSDMSRMVTGQTLLIDAGQAGWEGSPGGTTSGERRGPGRVAG